MHSGDVKDTINLGLYPYNTQTDEDSISTTLSLECRYEVSNYVKRLLPIVHDANYSTLYYTTKDVIYFYNTT